MTTLDGFLPILLGCMAAFVIIEVLIITIIWNSNQNMEPAGVRALGYGLLAIVLTVILFYLRKWLPEKTFFNLAIFILLYIPAAYFFARKYGSMIGFYISNLWAGGRPMAYPFGPSEVFLVLLLPLTACIAASAWVGWLVVVSVMMFLGIVYGVGKYQRRRFELWLGELEVREVEGAISYSSQDKAETKREQIEIGKVILAIFGWLSILASYLGLPVLIALLSPGATILHWIPCLSCAAVLVVIPVFYRVKRGFLFKQLVKEYAGLKEAELSGNIKAIAAGLDDKRLKEVSKTALRKQYEKNNSIFDLLIDILRQGQGSNALVDCLWQDMVCGRKSSYKPDPETSARLIDILSEKSVSVEQRAHILIYMVRSKEFLQSQTLQSRLPGLLSDSKLMARLKTAYGIEMKMA